MSLLKTLQADIVPKDTEYLKNTFKELAETITDKATQDDVAVLTQLYSEYSVQYLYAVATSLEAQPIMEAGMKFMNSMIAEAVHQAELHYYHAEGWSLVDKPVQEALDNQGTVKVEFIMDIIKQIEDSYIEDIPEEEAEVA